MAVWLRAPTAQYLRGRVKAMNHLDLYEPACKVRRLAWRTIQT